MKRKHLLGTMLLLGLSIGAIAQQEPGPAPTTEQQDAATAPEATIPTQATIEDKNVQSMIDEFLAKEGWTEGENKKTDGSIFVISIGIGTIQAPRSNRHFPASRVAAFNKAMLAAKRNMAEYLQILIKTETEKVYSEGVFPPPPTANPQNPDESSTLAKIQKLIHAKLDNALRAEGIDPDKAKKEELARAAKKELSSESYSKLINSAAQSYICGMQVCNSFESTPANKKGEIGVIAIWSPKLQKMAEVMLVGGTVPNGIPKQRLIEQIPNDPTILLTTFGVQQKLDEYGRLTLVAFGQEGAITDSTTSANAAVRKAQMNAQAAIREFAGENVAVGSMTLNAESVTEFENAEEEYSNSSAMREKIKATAEKMNISGIAILKRWKAKHPITGKYIYGVICTWSPDSAAKALNLRDRMNAAPQPPRAPAPRRPSAVQQDQERQLQQRSFSGAGLRADDDAF